jgi:hypothetical protein
VKGLPFLIASKNHNQEGVKGLKAFFFFKKRKKIKRRKHPSVAIHPRKREVIEYDPFNPFKPSKMQ